MFEIKSKQTTDSNTPYIELSSANGAKAKIFPTLGGSIQQLILNNEKIIDSESLPYTLSRASALLFPFVNRIKNGTYSYKQKEYKLRINDLKENNAIHGLVYDKTFKLVSKKANNSNATLTVSYTAKEKNKGYPFLFTVLMQYTLSNTTLNTTITIENNDTVEFPFNIGWHPYFFSSNRSKSQLEFKSVQKLTFDQQMIPSEIKDIPQIDSCKIEDKNLDDCYILKSNTIGFQTPDYKIEIESSAADNYLQLYTPKEKNHIAIEPMTAIANSFNNKLGISILKPQEEHQITWTINLIDINK